jgi:hypothetical protein
MTKIEEIEKAISTLAPKELAKFRRWYANFEAVRFDERIEKDAQAGRLDELARDALADFKAGRTRSL